MIWNIVKSKKQKGELNIEKLKREVETAFASIRNSIYGYYVDTSLQRDAKDKPVRSKAKKRNVRKGRHSKEVSKNR